MPDFVTLKDPTGAEYFVNRAAVAAVTPMGDGRTNAPIPGVAGVVLTGGACLTIKGRPATVAALLGGEPAEPEPQAPPLAILGPGGDYTREIRP